jgi:hypothetical protein
MGGAALLSKVLLCFPLSFGIVLFFSASCLLYQMIPNCELQKKNCKISNEKKNVQ